MALSGCAWAQAPVAGQPQTLRFDIFEFVIEGNTVLPPDVVERVVYPFLGPDKTVADAEGARKALEQAFQDAGYLSVNVELPPQRVDQGGGEVKLVVVQAPVDKLRVTGSRYHSPRDIRAQVPSLAPGSVPNFPAMQEQLASLQTGDREVTPLIAAGAKPATMDVELKVQDKLPLHGFAELNSKQAQNTERGRLEASASYDNLWQQQHSIGLYWFYSPVRPDQANILSLNYRLPLGGPGDQLFAVLTHSNTDTPTPLGGGTVTRGETYGLRWRNELDAQGSFQHALTFGGSYRHTRDRNREVAGFSTAAPPLRYPTFSLNYDLTDFGSKPGRLTTYEAGLTVGFAGLGSREVDCDGRQIDQFACKRAGASASFQVLTLGASWREPLWDTWTFYGRVNAQLASGPLVSAEQVTQGGVDSVRGYYEGEQAGDQSVALRLELTSPVFAKLGEFSFKGLGFFDRAQLRKIQPLPGEIASVQMGSYGLGLRVDTSFGLKASLDWAMPVYDTSKPADGGGLQPVTSGQRWELSVKQSF